MNRYVVNPATQTTLYNGDDERIRVVTAPDVGPSDTRIYMYDLDHRIVGEYGAAGVTDVKAEYIWTLPEVGASGPTGGDDGAGGYMPLAIVTGTTPAINWVHSHHNAKPILLTNSTGTVVAYTGHAVLGFPGQFANAVGLAGAQYYYNRYRDYNDVTGRYIQADPIGLAGDANPYAYAMGNTLRFVDPDGLNPVTLGRGAVVTGEILGGGLTIWCRSNIALCMRTIGPIALRVAPTTNSLLDMAKGRPDCPNWLGPIISQNRSNPPWPLPEAQGRPHSIPDRNGGYTTHDGNGGGKQFRPTGRPHGGIPRPNVKEWERDPRNPNPKGTRPVGPDDGVRPARPEDFRGRR